MTTIVFGTAAGLLRYDSSTFDDLDESVVAAFPDLPSVAPTELPGAD